MRRELFSNNIIITNKMLIDEMSKNFTLYTRWCLLKQAIRKGNMNTMSTREKTIILNNPTHKNVKHNSKLPCEVSKTCKFRRKVTFFTIQQEMLVIFEKMMRVSISFEGENYSAFECTHLCSNYRFFYKIMGLCISSSRFQFPRQKIFGYFYIPMSF